MSELTNEEIGSLIGIIAYDTGCTDSGIHDELLRQRLIEKFKVMSKEEKRIQLGRIVRDEFLSEDALGEGYGLEDVQEFIEWFDDYMR